MSNELELFFKGAAQALVADIGESTSAEHVQKIADALIRAHDLGATKTIPERQTVDEQVTEFHKLMEIPNRISPGIPDDVTLRLRLRLVIEEAFELCEASFDYAGRDDVRSYKQRVLALISRASLSPDLPQIADALGDIDYVVAGTRLQLGIHGRAVANVIHAANMAKAPGGVVRKDEYGKVQKPDDWKPADIEVVLRAQGWDGKL